MRRDGSSRDLKTIAAGVTEPRASIRSAALLTLGIAVSGLVIAAVSGGRDRFLIAAIICGAMIVPCWIVTLFIAALIAMFRSLRVRIRQAPPAKDQLPDQRGGVADAWLEGPF